MDEEQHGDDQMEEDEEEDVQGSSSSSGSASTSLRTKPIAMVVIGMAGSGKSTLTQRMNAYMKEKRIPSKVMNLDPAVYSFNYDADIDIRKEVDYKKVMQEYQLGPNGGIMTSLNLFATKFFKILDEFKNKHVSEPGEDRTNKEYLKYFLIDTPGQIEVFTWSASGTIITESISADMPTVIVYVIDTQRTMNPSTFMSNMLYACSILYKTKLPFIVAFNKIDVVPHTTALEWMSDFQAFQSALDEAQTGHGDDSGYMSSLTRSTSLVLDEFYSTLTSVGVSAATGAGMDELFDAIDKAAVEYDEFYLPDIMEQKKTANIRKDILMKQELSKVQADLARDEDLSNSLAGARIDSGNDAPALTVAMEKSEKINQQVMKRVLKNSSSRDMVDAEDGDDAQPKSKKKHVSFVEHKDQHQIEQNDYEVEDVEEEFEGDDDDDDYEQHEDEEEGGSQRDYDLLKSWLEKEAIASNRDGMGDGVSDDKGENHSDGDLDDDDEEEDIQ